jgi:HlyD family secretion protein
MKKRWLLALAALALVTLLVWALWPAARLVETAVVTQGRFERAVQEDGRTRLRERYLVSAPLGGRLTRITLRQGDAVAKNAVVALLWPNTPAMLDERSTAEQLARANAMASNLARAQAGVGRASAALSQARANLTRSETLAEQGFVSPNQNETGRLDVRLREQELESARQEEAATRHELEQVRVALRQVSTAGPAAQQRPFEVRSPAAGRVLKITHSSETVVPAGATLMELGDPSRLEVVVDLLTEDAAQISPGTPVQLAKWGGAAVLEGRVRLVEPAAFTKVSALGVEEQRVNAVVDITTAPTQWQSLGDGFKVDVRVLVQVVEQAIQVPVSALFPVGGRAGLFVLEQGHARLREVEISARNGMQAWIRTGLTPGTTVIVYPDAKLKDGEAVRPR